MMTPGRKNSLYKPSMRIVFGAHIFRIFMVLLTPVLCVWAYVDNRRKVSQFVRDIDREMTWTMSHLHPSMMPTKELIMVMGRYLTVDIRCRNYIVWITREFYGAGYTFWADVSSCSCPESRTRIEVLANREFSNKEELKISRFVEPQTLSDLDSMIGTLNFYLDQHFA